MKRMRAIVAAAGAALLASGTATGAADYPDQPIHIINPAPAGGGTDIVLRIYAEKMSEAWGQQVLVESRPGSEGMLAANHVARADPDGYTLLGTYDVLSINPAMQESLPYDTLNDFAPISLLSTVAMGLFAAPSLPADTVGDLIEFTRSNPGEITYASIGRGSPQWLVAELFNEETGAQLRHIPFKERSAIASDVMAGRVNIMISSIAGVQQLVESGKLKSLAVTTAARSPVLPDVPTLDESGLPGYEYFSWIGLLAPAGTPQEILDKINAEVRRIGSLPDVQERIAGIGGDVRNTTREEFGVMIETDIAKWTRLLGSTPD